VPAADSVPASDSLPRMKKQPAPVPEETAPDGNGDDGRAVAVADRMKKRRAPAFDAANNLPAVSYIYK